MLKMFNKRNIILIVVILIALLSTFGLIYFTDLFGIKDKDGTSNTNDTLFSYTDDFDDLNKDFWWVGQWVTLEDGSSKVEFENGIIKLLISETDRGPFLVSKPIAVNKGDIITIKRKVKLHYANEYFHGNILITQTEIDDLNPLENGNTWASVMYNTLTYVDYYHYYYEPEKRDVTHGFVLFAEDETTGKSYSSMDPIFDEWFEETLVYNTGTGEVTYNCNGQELTGTAKIIEEPYVRIILHAYGWWTGHEMQIDYVKIDVTD